MLDKICELIVRRTSLALHLPYAEIIYSLEQTIDGKLVKPVMRKRAKSWTRNAYNFITAHGLGVNNYGASFGAGHLLRKSTDGSLPPTLYRERLNLWDYPTHECGRGYRGAVGDTTHGIVIGDSASAWSFENYTISVIPDGSGSGQIHYNQMAEPTKSYAGSTLKVTLIRYFNNNSGGSITIKEIGLIGRFSYGGVAASEKILHSREVLSPEETFLDKAQLKVQYEISLTYP